MELSPIRAARKRSTSTRISKRGAIVFTCALLLAGCEGVPALSFAPLNPGGEDGRAGTREIGLVGGFRVRAPTGKCIDTSRTVRADGSATVVMANCANLGARADRRARIPGLILVTITPGAHGDVSTLATVLNAQPELLARSGKAEDVEVVALKTSRRAIYVNLVDQSAGGPAGVSPTHWKAALDVAGRGVVISVFGAEAGPIEGRAGERLARDAAQALLAANAETPEVSGSGGAAADAPEIVETAGETPDGVVSAFRRVFGGDQTTGQ